MSPTVGHFRTRYLPLTETFIYHYLDNHRRYDAFLCGLRSENLDKFPFEPRYILTEIPKWKPGFWYYGLQEKLRRTRPYYRHVIDTEEPDVVHAHFGITGAELAVSKPESTSLVTTFYGYDLSRYVKQDDGSTDRYETLFSTADLLLVEGPAMKQKLLDTGCPKDRVTIQRIAIDAKGVDPRPPTADGTWTVLMGGRFVEKKGFPDGVRAFAEAFRGRPDAELRIVGGKASEYGYPRERLERIAEEAGVLDQTVFTGFLDYQEYLEEVARCDVFLAPSKRAADGDSEGGAPTVLLEAQALGKPIVSTTHADIPFVVADGVAGHLVTPDRPAELTDALRRLAAAPDEAAAMGRRGREYVVENHDVRTLVDQLEEKYDTATKRKNE